MTNGQKKLRVYIEDAAPLTPEGIMEICRMEKNDDDNDCNEDNKLIEELEELKLKNDFIEVKDLKKYLEVK